MDINLNPVKSTLPNDSSSQAVMETSLRAFPDNRYLGIIHPRSKSEWVLDIFGLIAQGVIVPLIQLLVLTAGLKVLIPQGSGSIYVSPLISFLVSFLFIDYIYYWNHRLLHRSKLWNFHRVHHSIERLDIFASSRNSVWSPFFIVYLWIQPICTYLLHDPTPFVFGVILGNSLDLWRHSGLGFPYNSAVSKLFKHFLIFPNDHEWHHSRHKLNTNFGANLNWWDKLHGTFYDEVKPVQKMGVRVRGSTLEFLFKPWRLK